MKFIKLNRSGRDAQSRAGRDEGGTGVLARVILRLDERFHVVSNLYNDPFHGVRVARSTMDCKPLLFHFAISVARSRPRGVRSASLGGRSALCQSVDWLGIKFIHV